MGGGTGDVGEGLVLLDYENTNCCERENLAKDHSLKYLFSLLSIGSG